MCAKSGTLSCAAVLLVRLAHPHHACSRGKRVGDKYYYYYAPVLREHLSSYALYLTFLPDHLTVSACL